MVAEWLLPGEAAAFCLRVIAACSIRQLVRLCRSTVRKGFAFPMQI